MATKILSIEKVQAIVAKRNKDFKVASKAGKRIMIAQDVLAQIKVNKFVPESGSWLGFIFKDNNNPYVEHWDTHTFQYVSAVDASIQEKFFDKTIDQCRGCALGGLMLSCTLYNNKTTFASKECDRLGSVIESNEKISNGLNTIFSKSQLELIETAFELGEGQFNYADVEDGTLDPRPAKVLAAISFGCKFSNTRDRLKAIMRNVIKNEGTFKP